MNPSANMSNEHTNELHLPDLLITNFRGIRDLSIERLGRVTLITGCNGVGKTTILEAVRVYAARGHREELAELLGKREELVVDYDEDNTPILTLDYAALFHGRTARKEAPIAIGPNSDVNTLQIHALALSDLPLAQQDGLADSVTDGNQQIFQVTYNGYNNLLLRWPSYAYGPRYRRHRRRLQQFGFDDGELPYAVNYKALGPGLPDNSTLARFWDSVVLTNEENLALRALRMVDADIEGVAVVGDPEDPRIRRSTSRRVVVKYQGRSVPVPLKSLGDGAPRLFAAGLALANCHNGFLIVDEAENGIHYTVQQRFWTMILRAAQQYNIQVLATTHSQDCVAGFARAAEAVKEAEGILLRVEREDSEVRVIEYQEEDLEIAADQGIEVR